MRRLQNPQVDGLRDFRLLPLSELKRKHAAFLRAGRPKGKRNSPSRAQMPAPSTTLLSARSIRPTVPQVPAASDPSHPSAYSPRPSTHGFHPTVRQTLPAYRTTRHLAPWHGPSCISCIKPRHANYLQCQRYARQAPIALRASAPQARTAFRSWAPRSLMTLRASAPWTSTAFHAPRSAPQAPPHSSRACVFRLGAGLGKQ